MQNLKVPFFSRVRSDEITVCTYLLTYGTKRFQNFLVLKVFIIFKETFIEKLRLLSKLLLILRYVSKILFKFIFKEIINKEVNIGLFQV